MKQIKTKEYKSKDSFLSISVSSMNSTTLLDATPSDGQDSSHVANSNALIGIDMNVVKSPLGAGQYIQLLDSSTCAYYVAPSGNVGILSAGIVLIPDVHGYLEYHTIGYADHLAEHGYKVIIPDFHKNLSAKKSKTVDSDDGKKESREVSVQEMLHRLKALSFAGIQQDIVSAAQTLRDKYQVQIVGCLGLGWGGQTAFTFTRCMTNLFDCVVAICPTGISEGDEDNASLSKAHIQRPLLILMGGQDNFLGPEQHKQLQELVEGNTSLKMKIYNNEGHGFCYSNIVNEDAATQAIAEVLDWFSMHLSSFKVAASTSDEDPWWPQGRNGPFVNVGLKSWLETREKWRKQTRERPPPPPPVTIDLLVDDLTSVNRSFELPHRMTLADLVDVFVEIWDIDA